jgi:hypothetical protein
MKRPSDLKADIEKIKKLKALQQKATDKLDKITDKAAGTKPKKKAASVKKTTAQAVHKKPTAKKASDRGSTPKRKAKSSDRRSAAKKRSFWQKLFGGDAGMRS